jgi:hypothetical protein
LIQVEDVMRAVDAAMQRIFEPSAQRESDGGHSSEMASQN